MDQAQALAVEQAEQAKPGLLSTLWKNRHPYIFISPFFILYAIFGLFPMVFSLILSVTEWNGVGPLRFNGLDNWNRMLHDTVFWQAFLNGVILFFLYVPVMLVFALGLAVILNSPRIHGFRVFRAIIFLPFITNMVAAGFAFQILLTKNNGLINVVLGAFGIGAVPWLESIWGARISLALLIMWAWLGYNMVLMLAGLQTIPGDLVEAARVDGANKIQAFFRITLPLMRPILLFCAVISLMGSFGLFAEVRTLTNGGPMNATITPMIKIYNNAFQQFQLGYASTLSYTYFAILLVLTFIQFRYLGRNNT